MPNPPSPPKPPPPRPAAPTTPRPPAGPRVDGLWDTRDLATYLGLHPQTVKERVAAREYPHHRFGRSVRFTPEDVAEIEAAAKVPARTAPRRDEVTARRVKPRVA